MFTHLLLLLLVLPWGARSDTAADPALLTERFLRHVADLGLWSGTAACSSDAGVGSEMWQGAYGWASREMGAPMRPELSLPVGSNTKLMTAVAVMQLQARRGERQGLLNVSDPASRYFDPGDYPQPLGGRPWCPHLNTSGPGDPCEQVTISHLLAHSSGLPDALSCTGANPGSVPAAMLPYCLAAVPTNYSHVLKEVVGATPSVWEAANWTLGMPLFSKPGERFFYSNPAYWLLTALVEKLSNQTLGDYLHQHVFKPLGMNGTFYDTTNGAAGIHASSIDNGGYVSILTASSGPQNGSLKWGQQTVTWAPGISDAPHYPGLNALTLGAGAAMSTAQDMHTWYRALFGEPERLGLTLEDVEDIAAPHTIVSQAGNVTSAYGYGVIVAELMQDDTTVLAHTGGLFNFRSSLTLGLHPDGRQPLCAILGNTHAVLRFADEAAQQTFQQKCSGTLSTEQLLQSLAAAEPKLVADMSQEEREAALLAHLCPMQQIPADQGQSTGYVQTVLDRHIWHIM